MIIRPARGEDLPSLAVLFRQEIAYQRQICPFWELSPQFDCLSFLQTKLSNPHERLFVAERNAQLLGYILVRVIQAPHHRFPRNIFRHFFSEKSTLAFIRPPNTGSIEDCYVEPQSRRQRVGSALLKQGLEMVGGTRGKAHRARSLRGKWRWHCFLGEAGLRLVSIPYVQGDRLNYAMDSSVESIS